MTIREVNKAIQNLTNGDPTTIQVHAYAGDFSTDDIDVEIYLPEYEESFILTTYEGIKEHETEALKEVKKVYRSLLKKYPDYDVIMIERLLSC